MRLNPTYFRSNSTIHRLLRERKEYNNIAVFYCSFGDHNTNLLKSKNLRKKMLKFKTKYTVKNKISIHSIKQKGASIKPH